MLVRSDIPLAHQAVQAIHAGISAARDLIPEGMIHPNLVLCTVPNRDWLTAIEDKCTQAGIASRVFLEADMNDEPTALATQPVGKEMRKLFRDLPLFTGG